MDFTSLNLGLLKLKKIEMEENKLEKMKRKAVKFRLCLVAVKRFPENTYFLEMLISGKGKCFHGVWLHCKKFFGKYFLVFGKEKGKLKSENAE